MIVCALVYVAVSLQSVRAPALIAVLTPPAHALSTPAVTPVGVREAAVLSKLSQSTLQLIKETPSSNRHTVYLRQATGTLPATDALPAASTPPAADDPLAANVVPAADTLPATGSAAGGSVAATGSAAVLPPVSYTGLLELSTREGYVRGFTLELDALVKPVESKKKLTDYEMGLYMGRLYKYEQSLEQQRMLVHTVLNEMLALLDAKGDAPPALSIVWETKVESLTEGEAVTEQAGAILFSAVCTKTGKLLVSLNIQ